MRYLEAGITNCLLAVAAGVNDRCKGEIGIFAGHGVYGSEEEGIPPPSAIPFTELQASIRHLTRHFRIVGLMEAVAMLEGSIAWQDRCIVLTFDDSLSCMRQIVAPWLSEIGLTATFFLSTEAIDTQQPYWWLRMDYAFSYGGNRKISGSLSSGFKFSIYDRADLSGIRRLKRELYKVTPSERESVIGEIEDSLDAALIENIDRYQHAKLLTRSDLPTFVKLGMTVGSHTVTHPNLASLSKIEAEQELRESKLWIEEHSKAPCTCFCYPHGLFNDDTVRGLREYGYECAVTTRSPGWNSPRTDPFLLRRFYFPKAAWRTGILLNKGLQFLRG